MPETQNAPISEQPFAWIEQHGGPVVNWAAGRFQVEGEGLSGWFALDYASDRSSLEIKKNLTVAAGNLVLTVRLSHRPEATDKPVLWTSSLKVGERRYVSEGGAATDFPTALAQCEAHEHQSRQIGGLTWWRERNRMISWVGNFDLSAVEIASPGEATYWRFECSGNAPTFEEAALLAGFGRMGVLA